MGLSRPNGSFVGPGAARARRIEESYRSAKTPGMKPLTRREKRVQRARLHNLNKKRCRT